MPTPTEAAVSRHYRAVPSLEVAVLDRPEFERRQEAADADAVITQARAAWRQLLEAVEREAEGPEGADEPKEEAGESEEPEP